MNAIKEKLDEINNGCGKSNVIWNWRGKCGQKYFNYDARLCPECKAKKKGIIEGALLMINQEIEFLDWLKADKYNLEQYKLPAWVKSNIIYEIGHLQELKEYLEKQ